MVPHPVRLHALAERAIRWTDLLADAVTAITVMFRHILERLPDLRITSEPAFLESLFIHGIKRMRCEFTPARAS